MIKYLISLSLVLIVSKSYGQSKTYSYDGHIILPKLHGCDSSAKYFEEYFVFHGMKISNYYEIKHSLNINFYAKNKPRYLIIILSPITQRYQSKSFPCDKEEGRRLLVITSLNIKGEVTNVGINDNIIPNAYEYQTEPFCGLTPIKNGFSLCFFTGSINKCETKLNFILYNNNFILSSQRKYCYKTDLSNHFAINKIFKKKSINALIIDKKGFI